MSFLYIPITVVSWIFGSKGLAEDEKTSHTENIVLLAIGAATLVLDRMKPKKYKLFYKTRMQTYDKIIHRLEFQLARPAAMRKSPEDLLRKIQVELKVTNLNDNPKSELATISNQEMEEVVIDE